MLPTIALFCNLYVTMPMNCLTNKNNVHFGVLPTRHQIGLEASHLNQFFWLKSSPSSGYEESTIKRGKLIFFISIPFIFLIYAAIISTLHYAADQDSSFPDLPTEPFLFAGLSSLAIVGGIIYLDIQKTISADQESQLNFSISGVQPW